MKTRFLLFMLLPIVFFSCSEDQPLPEKVTISGSFVNKAPNSEGGGEVELDGVTVTLLQDGEQIMDSEGSFFQFDNLEPGRNYSLVPKKIDDDALNGISTWDVNMLKQYLEGKSDFNIYQLVAADIDRSLYVNEDDLEILRECILSPMMVYCMDWRFMHEECTSLNQKNLINKIQFKNLSHDQTDIKIYGIKSGNLTE